MPEPFAGYADRLVALMEKAGHDALEDVGNVLAARVIEDIPIGDPRLDPNPEYSLRENVHVRVYGRYVSVSVEGAYAVKQHEAVHFKHPRGGHAKFLEANAISMGRELQGMLAGTVQKTFASVRSRVKVSTKSL